ncbi:hypothetical protein Peur_034869 [Populus x canadensis]
MFKCFGSLYMFIFLLQSNGMPVFKRVVSICRSLSETLYYSTFHVTTYDHIHLRYCEIDMLLVILSLAVIFSIGLATVTLTCCW